MAGPVQVTLFSQRDTRELMGRLKDTLGRRKLSVLHVRGNPLSRTELGAALDVSRYGAAICVLDQSWVRCVRSLAVFCWRERSRMGLTCSAETAGFRRMHSSFVAERRTVSSSASIVWDRRTSS